MQQLGEDDKLTFLDTLHIELYKAGTPNGRSGFL